jgi:hypothetical protein
MLECDFCAGVDPRWLYPTAPTPAPPDRQHDPGGSTAGLDWYACQPCHELIEAGLWTELGARATTLTFAPHWHLPEDDGAFDPAVERQRDEAWARFRATRQGQARKLGRSRLGRLLPGAGRRGATVGELRPAVSSGGHGRGRR